MHYFGGVYLDVDVECVTDLGSLLEPLPKGAAWTGDFPEPMFLLSAPGGQLGVGFKHDAGWVRVGNSQKGLGFRHDAGCDAGQGWDQGLASMPHPDCLVALPKVRDGACAACSVMTLVSESSMTLVSE